MADEKVWAEHNLITPNKPIQFNEQACNGCNMCVENCLMDVFLPNPQKGKPPIVMYPDECFYEGACVMECPSREKGAIQFKWPLMYGMRWKRKETGEHFRLGMANPPAPNRTPPVGGWNAGSGRRPKS